MRAVKAIVEALVSGKPPHHLLLGNDAFEGAMAKVDKLRQDFMAGEALARGAELQPLSAINAVFERLAKGEVPSRVVPDFAC